MRKEPEAAGHFQCGRARTKNSVLCRDRACLLCWTFSLVGALPSTLSAASGACPLLCSTASSVLLRHLTPHCRACRTAAFAYRRGWGLPVIVHIFSRRARGL